MALLAGFSTSAALATMLFRVIVLVLTGSGVVVPGFVPWAGDTGEMLTSLDEPQDASITAHKTRNSQKAVRVTAVFRGERVVIGLAELAFGFAQKTRKNPGDCETVPQVAVTWVGLSAIRGEIVLPVASLGAGLAKPVLEDATRVVAFP
jgi:hypothetical protein